MATAEFEELLPDVLPFAAACPQPTALVHIRRAANIFFSRVLEWEYTEEWEQPATASGVAIAVPVPTDTEVAKTLEVYFGGIALHPATKLRMRGQYNDPRAAGASAPHAFATPTPSSIQLVPGSAEARSLRVVAAIAPTNAAAGMDAELMDRHRDAIAAGALGRILMLPGQMFSDPALGASFASAFSKMIGAATIEANLGHATAGERIQFQPTCRGR